MALLRTRIARFAYKSAHAARSVGSARRVLPDFLILGAQRSGTSSLYGHLSRHPSILSALIKEVHYFDLNPHRGLGWYRVHFPLGSSMRKGTPEAGRCVTGEATPYYLFHPRVPDRVHASLPNARLIVLLRNPVDRAQSHYFHEVRRGRETLPFLAAVARERERLPSEAERLMHDARYVSPIHQHRSYLHRGHYAEQLTSWWKWFSRDSILILKAENLFSHPGEVAREIFRFLGVADRNITDSPIRNRGSYQRLEPEALSMLREYYEPHNQRLYDLIGENFGWQEHDSRR